MAGKTGKDTIVMGSDHGGFRLKERIKDHLIRKGLKVRDEGTYSGKSTDYPDDVGRAARQVSKGKAARGIVFCTTGTGASIVANKYPNVRAALVFHPRVAGMTREHNDSNILVLSGGFLGFGRARKIVDRWLATPFSAEKRHHRRVNKIKKLDKKYLLVAGLCLLLSVSLSAREYRWEGSSLEDLYMENCAVSVEDGQAAVTRGYAMPVLDPRVTLYLGFNEDGPLRDGTGRHRISEYNVLNSRENRFRDSPSGGFVLDSNRISVELAPGSVLDEQTDMESFTLSFWLNPSLVSGRRVVIEKGNYHKSVFHGLRIYIGNGRLVLSMSNMFFDSTGRNHSRVLQTREALRVGRWNNYCLSYDNTTGKAVLYLNGGEEDVTWATAGGVPEGEIFIPRFSGHSDLVIGEDRFGFMDDLFVSPRFYASPPYASRRAEGPGLLLTPVIENKFHNSQVREIVVNRARHTPGVVVLVRTNSRKFDPGLEGPPDWVVYRGPVTAKYFQAGLGLIHAGTEVPEVRSLIITTSEMLDLEPPSGIVLDASGDVLKVSWDGLNDGRVAGYYVYLADGRGLIEKADAGNSISYRFPGLKDRHDYYVAVSAYDGSAPRNESGRSRVQKIHYLIDRSTPDE